MGFIGTFHSHNYALAQQFEDEVYYSHKNGIAAGEGRRCAIATATDAEIHRADAGKLWRTVKGDSRHN